MNIFLFGFDPTPLYFGGTFFFLLLFTFLFSKKKKRLKRTFISIPIAFFFLYFVWYGPFARYTKYKIFLATWEVKNPPKNPITKIPFDATQKHIYFKIKNHPYLESIIFFSDTLAKYLKYINQKEVRLVYRIRYWYGLYAGGAHLSNVEGLTIRLNGQLIGKKGVKGSQRTKNYFFY